MRAASQLPVEEPTDMDDAPALARNTSKMPMMMNVYMQIR